MNYSQALAWLYATQHHGIKLGLENIRGLVSGLGLDLAGFRFLHVAGTNGKGSVCAMLASICQAGGLRTGLFTSPHLVSFRERIVVDGEMIDEEHVAEDLTRIAAVIAERGLNPTFFEITTALALMHFQREKADVVVLETGMGGRLDSTNIVTPAVSVITPIDLDHQAWLGDTLGKIAREKAGIIKPGIPVVSAPQCPEAEEVLRNVAEELGAPISFVNAPLTLPVNLAGTHQKWNAALALAALDAAKLPTMGLKQGLATVVWPGRFQRIHEKLVLDGAHNRASALRLAETWREVFGSLKARIVVGILQDKDAREIAEALAPIAESFIAVPVQSSRSRSPEDLLETLRPFAPARATESLSAGLQLAENKPVLVTGSLFLIGEALALLGNLPRESSAQ